MLEALISLLESWGVNSAASQLAFLTDPGTMLFAVWETVYAPMAATVFAYILGLPLGILLVIGEEGGVRPLPRPLMRFLNITVNLLRSIPFLILMVVVMPLSRVILGTSVGTAATALVKYMLAQNADIGRTTGTVNPLVCECNDGFLNDIQGFHVKEEHIFQAIAAAQTDFAEGAVGAGTGMCCLGFKGGIGSASRVVLLDGCRYTVGALVLSNFGGPGRLMIDGRQTGREIQNRPAAEQDKGSIIMLIAVDIPLSERQLKRICRRAGAGLARTGSYYGNGSGDIAIAFTTANRVPHDSPKAFIEMKMLSDDHIDPVLDLTAEAVEEAIISSLWHAATTTGRDGHIRRSLREFLNDLPVPLG